MNTRFTKIGGTGNSKRMSKRSGEDVIIVRSSAGAVLGGGGELNEEERARKLLGISVSDDALAIQQAVNKKKMLYKGDNEKLREVESAYDTIQRASLAAGREITLHGRSHAAACHATSPLEGSSNYLTAALIGVAGEELK